MPDVEQEGCSLPWYLPCTRWPGLDHSYADFSRTKPQLATRWSLSHVNAGGSFAETLWICQVCQQPMQKVRNGVDRLPRPLCSLLPVKNNTTPTANLNLKRTWIVLWGKSCPAYASSPPPPTLQNWVITQTYPRQAQLLAPTWPAHGLYFPVFPQSN